MIASHVFIFHVDAQVSTRAITKYVGPNLEFAELARDWLGYQPKLNHEALIQHREAFRQRTRAATTIQQMVRKKIAYNAYREKRRRWLVHVVIPRAQARIRGVLQRRIYAVFKLKQLHYNMATKIQSAWRRFMAILRYEARLEAIEHEKIQHYKATKIKVAYRCMKARMVVQELRNAKANIRLAEAKHHAMCQLMAIEIQRVVRAKLGRMVASKLAAKRDHERRMLALHTKVARYLQRILRGWMGRLAAKRRRKEKAYLRLVWLCARSIQRFFRGFLGRMKARMAWEEFYKRLRYNAASNIQRVWRGTKARAIAAMALALRQLRVKKYNNTILIQRIWRGYRARKRVDSIRVEELKVRTRLLSAIGIQKLYRGYKGREAAEVERALTAMEGQAQPLFQLMRKLENDIEVITKKLAKLTEQEKRQTIELEDIERESLHTNNTTNKWTDSSRVNGYPQRFLTKFLRIRLEDYVKIAQVIRRYYSINKRC